MPDMGFFDGLRDALTQSSGSGTETCPECGAPLVADGGPDDRGTERFECSSMDCAEPVHFRENGGPLMSPWERNRSGGGSCEAYGQSLRGAELTTPWEDGDNSNAYVTCRHCGHRNLKIGFGEDD